MKGFLSVLLAVTMILISSYSASATNSPSAELTLSADSAILIDADSKAVLFSKNESQKRGMASTTKIMTALVAAENFDLKKEIKVSPEAVGIEGSSVYLYAGEILTMEELLCALLLQSANDAATAIAIAVSGSVENFSELMNKKARDLGLENTHFTNPHGLYDEDHYTTAYDLAIIASELLKNEVLAKIVSTYKITIPIDSHCNERLLVNHNKMLKLYDGANGMKTGFTKATGRCLVSSSERDGLTLIAVTLSAPDDWNDHKKMLDFGFSNYQSVVVAKKGEFTYKLPLAGGERDYLSLTNTQEIRMTLPRQREDLSIKVETFHRIEFAPVMRGTELGKVTYSYNGKQFVSSPLAAAENSTKRKDNDGLLERLFGLSDK